MAGLGGGGRMEAGRQKMRSENRGVSVSVFPKGHQKGGAERARSLSSLLKSIN